MNVQTEIHITYSEKCEAPFSTLYTPSFFEYTDRRFEKFQFNPCDDWKPFPFADNFEEANETATSNNAIRHVEDDTDINVQDLLKEYTFQNDVEKIFLCETLVNKKKVQTKKSTPKKVEKKTNKGKKSMNNKMKEKKIDTKESVINKSPNQITSETKHQTVDTSFNLEKDLVKKSSIYSVRKINETLLNGTKSANAEVSMTHTKKRKLLNLL